MGMDTIFGIGVQSEREKMNILWGFHAWSEKNILNTLTKKIMSIMLLFFINLLYLGIFIVVKGSVLETLGQFRHQCRNSTGHRIGI